MDPLRVFGSILGWFFRLAWRHKVITILSALVIALLADRDPRMVPDLLNGVAPVAIPLLMLGVLLHVLSRGASTRFFLGRRKSHRRRR